jgi:hypothetical protein
MRVTSKSSKPQLNVRVKKPLRSKVFDDSNTSPFTRDVVVGAILDDFFRAWSKPQRMNIYKRFKLKESK